MPAIRVDVHLAANEGGLGGVGQISGASKSESTRTTRTTAHTSRPPIVRSRRRPASTGQTRRRLPRVPERRRPVHVLDIGAQQRIARRNRRAASGVTSAARGSGRLPDSEWFAERNVLHRRAGRSARDLHAGRWVLPEPHPGVRWSRRRKRSRQDRQERRRRLRPEEPVQSGHRRIVDHCHGRLSYQPVDYDAQTSEHSGQESQVAVGEGILRVPQGQRQKNRTYGSSSPRRRTSTVVRSSTRQCASTHSRKPVSTVQQPHQWRPPGRSGRSAG